MKKVYKNRVVLIVFLACVAFSFSIYDCKAGDPGLPGNLTKIKAEKEILVAKDVGGGKPFSIIRWCGNEALLIYGGEFGTEWVDFSGNKVIVSTKGTDFPVDCTPDGKWVIYKDRESSWLYKDKQGRLPENILDEGIGWHGLVIDLYRYEIATGRRQKFAVVRDDSGSLVSPDGSKVLLGNKHDSTIDMPEPKWDKVWLKNEWTYNRTFWFADSSGVVTAIWGNGSGLGVEIFGEDGWAKEYDFEQLGFGTKPRLSVYLKAVDKENRLYFITGESIRVSKRMSRKKYRFLRCKINDRDISCEEFGILSEDEKGIEPNLLNLLPDGNIIFIRGKDSCIHRLKPGETDAECIADVRYEDDTYKRIRLRAVSPDGKWIAFTRGKEPPKPGGRFYRYQLDLFVKEIPE